MAGPLCHHVLRHWRRSLRCPPPAPPPARPAAALPLRVGRVGQAQPAARVALAGQQRSASKRAGLRNASQRSSSRTSAAGAELAAAVHVAVLARHHLGQFAAVASARAAAPTSARTSATLRCSWPMWRGQHRRAASCPCRGRGPGRQSAPAAAPAGARHVEHHHQVHAGVDLGVVVGALRHAPQAVDLGQQPRQRAAAAQHLEHARRARLPSGRAPVPATRARAPARRPRRPATICAHQRQRLGATVKSAKRAAKRASAQDAHRVFGEGRRDVAQHACRAGRAGRRRGRSAAVVVAAPSR